MRELSEPQRNKTTTEKSQSWFRFSSVCYYQTREFTPATVNPHKVRDRCRCPVCLVWTHSSGRGFFSFLIYTVLIRYQWSRRLKIRSRARGILSLSLSFFLSCTASLFIRRIGNLSVVFFWEQGRVIRWRESVNVFLFLLDRCWS